MNYRFKNIECRVLQGKTVLINFLYPVDLDKNIENQILNRTKTLLEIDNIDGLTIQVLSGYKKLWSGLHDLNYG
jgi:hypothetical protein